MSEQPQHDPKTIIASEAFKVINHQIGLKVQEITFNIEAAKRIFNGAAAGDDHLRMRTIQTLTHEERVAAGDRYSAGEVAVGIDLNDVERLVSCLQDARKAERDIGDLKRLKLRLLNDYDFTHGNPEEQIKIFGPPPESAG